MNKDTITKFIIFVVGAAIGSAVTWKLVKTKYERIAKEEIDSVKEVFSRPKSEPEQTDKEVEDYKNNLVNLGYSAEDLIAQGRVEITDDDERPYVIPPEEFGESYGYDAISLTYYSDGVLTDDFNELVEDVDNVVGLGSLTHFGEYEEDSVFVRNDRLKCDYEILLDSRKYSDVINLSPHPREG